MLCGGIITFNITHLPVRICKEAVIIFVLLNFYYMPAIAQDSSVSSDGEGWFLQGDPVITKDEEIDLPPCYTGRTVTVTNGKGHGSQTYSAECFKDGYGTYSSDVTWTPPPAYMKPGSSISFSMKFTSPDENPTSGAIKANSGTIVEGSSKNPNGESTATFTVPNGSPGNDLEIYTSFVMISGLHGYVTYNYKYQGAIANTAPAKQPSQLPPSQTVSIPDTELQPTTGTANEPSSDIAGGTETIRGPSNVISKEEDSSKGTSGGGPCDPNKIRDSGVRFSALTGQVSIRPECDPDAWRGAGLKSIIRLYDHVRTGEESWAILSFPDMTTLVIKPESEWIIDTPPGRDSKWKLVLGKIRTNIKKMLKGGTMEIQMSQAVAGIKGTTLVCEETGSSSRMKVIDGTASIKSKATEEEVLVNAGEMVTATATGLSPPEAFEVESENASWEPYLPTTEATEPEESTMIYDSWNLDFVDNNPTCSPFFTISEPQMITYIDTYHWNYGTGATGGTISLRSGDGTLYGPWEAETALDQGEVPRGYWIAHPNEIIPAGTYTVEDSDPDTWSKNSKSPCGFTKVEGYPCSATSSPGGGSSIDTESKPSSNQQTIEDWANKDVILIEEDKEQTITTNDPLKLAEGYVLRINSISADGNNVFLDLLKDNMVVDSKIVSPAKEKATADEKTYRYTKVIGNSKRVTLIEVHFKNAFRAADMDLATIIGVKQISENSLRYVSGAGGEISTDAVTWINKGVALHKQGKYDKAIEAYDQAIGLNPEYAEAWYNKGIALRKQGNNNEAIEAYDEAIRLDPQDADAWYSKGVAFYEQGKYDKAIEAYDQAIGLNPEYAEAWYNKGIALRKQGNNNEAIEAYDEAIRLDPQDADAWYSKGIALDALGRDTEASRAYAKAKELGHED